MSESILLPRILLTNDDGIDAPGLQLLADIASEFTNETWIVAPEHECSGSGMSVSLCKPVRTFQRGERSWAIDGTPGDCVIMALSHFMKDAPPSLVLSGVNAGHNIGDNINASGTAGAALIALIHGVPAIAISQCRPEGSGLEKTPWETTRAILPMVLKTLLAKGWRKETCLSINIPNCNPDKISGYSWARQSHMNIETLVANRRVDLRRQEYFWITIKQKQPKSHANNEHAILRRNEVAVTALTLDRSVDIAKPSIMFNNKENESSALDDDDILDN